MHTLLGRVSLLLCALMAAGAASQIAAPGAARSNHLRGSRSSYLQRASIREPVYNSAGEVQESAISSILDESLNATRYLSSGSAGKMSCVELRLVLRE